MSSHQNASLTWVYRQNVIAEGGIIEGQIHAGKHADSARSPSGNTLESGLRSREEPAGPLGLAHLRDPDRHCCRPVRHLVPLGPRHHLREGTVEHMV